MSRVCEHSGGQGTVHGSLPVAFAGTGLLDAFGVGVDVPGFAEVAREMLVGVGGAVDETDVVTVVGFVGAGHCLD